MKCNAGSLLSVLLFTLSMVCGAQSDPRVERATPAILNAFQSHDIVMLGEIHGNKQEYQWLRSLVASPEFADRVDDIVMEFGNSLYQQAVDRYVSGQDVPMEEVQGAWRDTVASVGSWPIPSIVSLADNWVGDLSAIPVVTEGHGPALPSLKLKDAADALLYFGPPASLDTVQMSRLSWRARHMGMRLSDVKSYRWL
jgi:hypothetical protein